MLSYSAHAQNRNINVPECEKRIRQLAVAAHAAGMAWGELNEVRNLKKSHNEELEKRDQTHEAYLKAEFEAITCLYDRRTR